MLVEWQPAKDDGIHDREDRGRRADAKRQHDEGRDREVLDERSERRAAFRSSRMAYRRRSVPVG